MVGFVNRNRKFLYLVRGVWLDQCTDEYLSLIHPANIIQRNIQLNYETVMAVIGIYADENNKLQVSVNALNDNKLKEEFYKKNIRIYHGGFDNLLESKEYYLQDNFKASAEIIADLNFYLRRMKNVTSKYNFERRKIYSNMYNDYQIVSENMEYILQNSINLFIENISSKTNIIYIITFIFLMIFLMVFFAFLTQYYLETAKFLSLFANHSSADLLNRIHSLELLKQSMESEFKSHHHHHLSKEEPYSIQVKNIHKPFRTKRLMRKLFIQRFVLFIIFILPSIVVLSSSYNTAFTKNDLINNEVSSIIKINRICTQAILFINELIVNELLSNNMVAKNQYARDILDSELDALQNSVSSNQDFSPEMDSLLSENLCTYYRNYGLGECEKMLKGIAVRGIRAFIYEMISIFREERNFVKNKPYTSSLILYLLTREYRSEMFLISTSAMLPASQAFVDRLGQNLILELDEKMMNTIKEFIVSIFLDLFGLAGMYWIIYKVLMKERRRVSDTLGLVPLDFVVLNNQFKMYLIKENKEFVKLFKSSDLMIKKATKK